MSISAKASMRLKFQSQRQLASLIDALTPEAKAPVTRRANVRLKQNGVFLELSVDADDTIALRSTMNAYLRWINSTLNVLELIEHS
jgi:tRNA threonylcarbamoyladenosine modification (KEOPS) complex  Pcc1 subunit